ncbi:MAG: hypothetical protein LAO03_21995 [Acidobacteriia bacterium]|nr:hypothetical protein [Terriglobia bacterium]
MRTAHRFLKMIVLPISLLVAAPTLWSQTPGQNVNMVSGTKWPGGDPFLQRQNEPSLAVSTRNPIHLLAGANDYRSVDIPNPIFVARFIDLDNQEGGDASQSLDPIRYIGVVPVDTGTSGQFLDKPWIAVDVPRGTNPPCTLQVPQGNTTVTQTIPAGNIYAEPN